MSTIIIMLGGCLPLAPIINMHLCNVNQYWYVTAYFLMTWIMQIMHLILKLCCSLLVNIGYISTLILIFKCVFAFDSANPHQAFNNWIMHLIYFLGIFHIYYLNNILNWIFSRSPNNCLTFIYSESFMLHLKHIFSCVVLFLKGIFTDSFEWGISIYNNYFCAWRLSWSLSFGHRKSSHC